MTTAICVFKKRNSQKLSYPSSALNEVKLLNLVGSFFEFRIRYIMAFTPLILDNKVFMHLFHVTWLWTEFEMIRSQGLEVKGNYCLKRNGKWHISMYFFPTVGMAIFVKCEQGWSHFACNEVTKYLKDLVGKLGSQGEGPRFHRWYWCMWDVRVKGAHL